AEWREVFESYAPPRAAVGEVWVADPARRARYASRTALGQAFNFDLLLAGFDAAEFRSIIEANLDLAARTDSSSTWVLSNHDAIRHVSRYGLPVQADADRRRELGRRWLLTGGREPVEDTALGLARAQAASLLIMALPGSVYLYQGEELGLREVADLPATVRQDPTFRRSAGFDVGRDGARVPLPWAGQGPSFGFGAGVAHLPQPAWFGGYAVAVEEADPDSPLNLYRRALAARRTLLAREDVRSADLEWAPAPAGTLGFNRGPWHCLVNFSATAGLALPAGRLLVSSPAAGSGSNLPPAAAAWVLV
ncbi:MAG: alpha-amylase, partial [Bifidobacteriaceae bacterium]|nr:alpha-amylase [Bifidobacteriaceae bacterium]